MRYLDVCSGYSAFTIANRGLGFECAGYSEIEAFPRAILEQRHGAVAVDWDHRHVPGSNVTPLFGDFTQIEAHHVGPVDLLAGGTPCQAFSVAGKRLGLDDPRGNLTLEFLALARRLRVQWLVWENVPGFLSHDDGRTMGTFLRLLGELGYGWAYRVLDAQYVRVDGHERAVPQRRRRLFVVGHLGDAAGPAAVLFERESLRGSPAPRRETGKGTAPTLSARTRGGGGLGTDFDCDGGLIAFPERLSATACASTENLSPALGSVNPTAIAFGGNNTTGPIDVATARSAHGGPHGRLDFESETFVMQAGVTRENPDSGPDGVGVQTGAAYTLEARSETQIVAHPTAATVTRGAESGGKGGYAGRRQKDDVNLVAHALRAEGFDASEDGTGRGTPIVPVYAINANCYDRSDEGANGSARERAGLGVQTDVAYALRSKRPDAVATDWAVRRLTPTECERLMGVPDGFTAITYRGKPAADGPRYKALGNSQAVNVMRWIAHGLRAVADAQLAAPERHAA